MPNYGYTRFEIRAVYPDGTETFITIPRGELSFSPVTAEDPCGWTIINPRILYYELFGKALPTDDPHGTMFFCSKVRPDDWDTPDDREVLRRMRDNIAAAEAGDTVTLDEALLLAGLDDEDPS